MPRPTWPNSSSWLYELFWSDDVGAERFSMGLRALCAFLFRTVVAICELCVQYTLRCSITSRKTASWNCVWNVFVRGDEFSPPTSTPHCCSKHGANKESRSGLSSHQAAMLAFIPSVCRVVPGTDEPQASNANEPDGCLLCLRSDRTPAAPMRVHIIVSDNENGGDWASTILSGGHSSTSITTRHQFQRIRDAHQSSIIDFYETVPLENSTHGSGC